MTITPLHEKKRRSVPVRRLPAPSAGQPLSTLNNPLVISGDARKVAALLPPLSVDLIVTSPPYWRKRDYGHAQQLGQEATPDAFVKALLGAMDSWRAVLKPSASVFLNLGDSIRDGQMVGVTTLFEVEAIRHGWGLASRIMWAKRSGLPDPHGRLAQRYELIFQLTPPGGARPYTDTFAYSQRFDLSEGNIWHMPHRPSRSAHLAPFPEELPSRALLLACPERVCAGCGQPLQRMTQRGLKLDPARKQSEKALERWHAASLTTDHLRAIRATGISDAGKSLKYQDGAGANSAEVTQLAAEAKRALGGYFREFTFALPEHCGWTSCQKCEAGTAWLPGLVLDPFVGTGTTLRAAQAAGRRSVGVDLRPMLPDPVQP